MLSGEQVEGSEVTWKSKIEKPKAGPRNIHNLNVSFTGKNVELRRWVMEQAEANDVPEAYIIRALIREAMEAK